MVPPRKRFPGRVYDAIRDPDVFLQSAREDPDLYKYWGKDAVWRDFWVKYRQAKQRDRTRSGAMGELRGAVERWYDFKCSDKEGCLCDVLAHSGGVRGGGPVRFALSDGLEAAVVEPVLLGAANWHLDVYERVPDKRGNIPARMDDVRFYKAFHAFAARRILHELFSDVPLGVSAGIIGHDDAEDELVKRRADAGSREVVQYLERWQEKIMEGLDDVGRLAVTPEVGLAGQMIERMTDYGSEAYDEYLQSMLESQRVGEAARGRAGVVGSYYAAVGKLADGLQQLDLKSHYGWHKRLRISAKSFERVHEVRRARLRGEYGSLGRGAADALCFMESQFILGWADALDADINDVLSDLAVISGDASQYASRGKLGQDVRRLNERIDHGFATRFDVPSDFASRPHDDFDRTAFSLKLLGIKLEGSSPLPESLLRGRSPEEVRSFLIQWRDEVKGEWPNWSAKEYMRLTKAARHKLQVPELRRREEMCEYAEAMRRKQLTVEDGYRKVLRRLLVLQVQQKSLLANPDSCYEVDL
ncbi:MAG: hypothetical protein HC945_03955 [Nitrosarchaeum sp.]|nr:hypothetical protein [Nitrosarchaeum sp.]